jgi:hypothetical protein
MGSTGLPASRTGRFGSLARPLRRCLRSNPRRRCWQRGRPLRPEKRSEHPWRKRGILFSERASSAMVATCMPRSKRQHTLCNTSALVLSLLSRPVSVALRLPCFVLAIGCSVPEVAFTDASTSGDDGAAEASSDGNSTDGGCDAASCCGSLPCVGDCSPANCQTCIAKCASAEQQCCVKQGVTCHAVGSICP